MNWYQRIAHNFPVFHVSDDDQFGDIGIETKKEKLRYSLLTLWLGRYLIHILSIKSGKPSLVTVLDLDVILNKIHKVNEESINKYTDALNNFNEGTIRDHIETLKLKIDEEQNRFSITLNKTAIYNAALLVVLTIAFPYLLKLYEMKSIILILLVPFGLLFYASALILSFKMLKIASINSFGFNDVAKSEHAMLSLASGLYYRYKHAQSEGDRLVSYNTNLQKNTKQFLMWFLIALVALNAQGLIERLSKPVIQPVGIYQLNHEKRKIPNLQALNQIENDLLQGQSTGIIITGGEEAQVEKVHSILDFYNVNEVPIEIIKSKGDTEMSLIVVKGDK